MGWRFGEGISFSHLLYIYIVQWQCIPFILEKGFKKRMYVNWTVMDKRTEILERVCVQKQPCLNVGWVHEMEFEEDLEEETEIWGLGSEDTRAVEEEMQWECRPAAEPPADSKSTRTEGYCSERQEHCRAKWARGFQEWEAAILFSRKYLKLKMHPFKGEHLLKNQKPNFHWITTVTLLVWPEINAEGKRKFF